MIHITKMRWKLRSGSTIPNEEENRSFLNASVNKDYFVR